MSSNLLLILKYSPVYCGVAVAFVYLIVKMCTKGQHKLEDVFMVGISASSVPAGLMLVYAAIFDIGVLQSFSEMSINVALGGIGLVYVSFATMKEKFLS